MTSAGSNPVAHSREVVLVPVSTVPEADAVVTVCKSPVGAHAGLSYRADDAGMRRHLHLAFHHLLRNDEAPSPDAFWVRPRLDEFELADVRASAHLIGRRHEDGKIPYAFQRGTARFSAAGALELNGSLGLTCATFLELVFAHANILLLDTPTWEEGRSPARRAADEAALTQLVAYLRKRPDAVRHADHVEKDVRCTRIRAEEVAAASGMSGHPIPFVRAEPEGARILAVVQATHVPSPPTTPPRGANESAAEAAPEE